MKPRTRKHTSVREKAREKKKMSIRHKVNGETDRPRLSVFRSARHIYAQIIDDISGRTLVHASTLDLDLKNANRDTAKAIGQEIAKRAAAKNIKLVVFDRSGYLYHGRIQALADGAREGGLSF